MHFHFKISCVSSGEQEVGSAGLCLEAVLRMDQPHLELRPLPHARPVQ